MDLIVTCDGGADPNPGRGYGSYQIAWPARQRTRTETITFAEGPLSNNEAEYLTLVQALHRLITLVPTYASRTVEVVCDSRLVVNQVAGQWGTTDSRMAALADAARSLLNRFASWSIRWVGRDEIVAILGH